MNRKYTSELNAARQEVFQLKEHVADTKQALEASERAREEATAQYYEDITAQKKITERVQLELASSRKAEDRMRAESEQLAEKVRAGLIEQQRLKVEIDSERKEHSTTKSELAEAKANAQVRLPTLC